MLFAELNKNTSQFTKFIVQTANLMTDISQRSTDLSQSFTTIRSNVFGVVGAPTSITDITATNAGPYYYRVGVQ